MALHWDVLLQISAIVVSSASVFSDCRPAFCHVSQGSLLELLLVVIHVKCLDMDVGGEIGHFAGGTKTEGVVGSVEGNLSYRMTSMCR